MTEIYRLTDLIERLKKVRDREGNLVLMRPSINAHDKPATKLVSISVDGTETLYEE